jgi:hypothetical protein
VVDFDRTAADVDEVTVFASAVFAPDGSGGDIPVVLVAGDFIFA